MVVFLSSKISLSRSKAENLVCDSLLFDRDLTEAFSKETMESHLNEETRAVSRAFEAMAESSLLMSVVRIRYIEHTEEVFKQLPEDAFGIFSPIFFWFAKRSLASKVGTIVLRTPMLTKNKRACNSHILSHRSLIDMRLAHLCTE